MFAQMAHFPNEVRTIEPADVLIVGGGPAGLAAATYLGRFRRSVIVVDTNDSRAAWIPESHNCPGFPDGISGLDLLDRLRRQATKYNAVLVEGRVDSVSPFEFGFRVETSAGPIQCRKIILATGVVDRTPALPRLHQAISEGGFRLCPVCDGYEVIDRQVAVIGPEERALREATFLRHFSPHVTIIANRTENFSAAGKKDAAEAGIKICEDVADLVPSGHGYEAVLDDGSRRRFDVVYPAMGCDVRAELATALGLHCSEDGYVEVDRHQQTSLKGIYAIGDLVEALNQIAVGFGHAAIAATDVHNQLCSEARKGDYIGLPPVTGRTAPVI